MFKEKKKIFLVGWSAPIILFLFAFMTRVLLIGKGLYHPDAITFFLKAQELETSGQLHGYLTGYNLPVILGALFLRIGASFGMDAISSLNMLSVVCGTISILAFYILCLRLFDRLTAFMSTMVLLCLPHLFFLSTFANSQIVTLPFLLLGFCTLVGQGEKSSKPSWVLAAFLFGLAAASRPLELVIMFPGILFLLWIRGVLNEKGVHRFFMFWGIVVLMVLVVPLPFLFYNGTFPDIARFRSLFVNYLVDTPTTFNAIFPMFIFSAKVYYNEFQYGLIFVLIGWVLIFQKNRVYFIFLLLWFLGTFVGYTITFHKLMPTTRYLLLSFLPAAICVGYGVSTLYSRFSAAYSWRLNIILILCVLSIFIPRIPLTISVLSVRHAISISEDFGRWVGRETPPDAVIIANDERDFIREYGHRQIINPSRGEYFSEIEKYLEKGSPLFLVSVFNNQSMMLKFEKQGYRLIPMGEAPFECWVNVISLDVFYETLYKIERIPNN